MKLFTDHDPETLALRRRVRVFLLATAFLGIAALLAVAARQGVFTQTIPLYFFAETAQDINKGMAVKVIGFKIGKVEQISIEPDNRVKVKVGVNDEYSRLIPRDSTARVLKEGLIGASIIEIQPGKDRSRAAAPGDVLNFERDTGLADLAKRLTDQVIPILQDVKQITASVNDPKGNIRQAVSNISEATVAIRASSEELQQLLRQGNEKAGAIGGKVLLLLDKTDNSMAVVEKSLQTLGQSLPGIMQKVDGSLENTRQVSENLRKISQEAAEQAPGLLRDGRAVAGDAREIVGGAKKVWPIRNLVTTPQSGQLPLDSYVAPKENAR